MGPDLSSQAAPAAALTAAPALVQVRPGWRRPFADWPIRRKLQAMVLLPLLGVLPLLGLGLLFWGDRALDHMLVTKVRSDLAVAHGYFDRVLGEVASATSAVADSHLLHQALARGHRADQAALQALLARVKQQEGLDFINLRRADGSVLLTDFDAVPSPVAATLPAPMAATGLVDPTGTASAADARVRAAVAVLSPTQQALLAPALRERVPVALLSTRNARPSPRSHEDRALVVLAQAPVRAADGSLLALVQGGVLLNRNLPFIDHINEIVYPQDALPFGSKGTATLFLDDVRISTNVRLFAQNDDRGEARAIGTRVSQQVFDAVLGRGETWLGRAFVVNDWYVSAYEPLTDHLGQRVGMLYVGYLETPFTWLKYGVLAGIGAVFFGVMIVAAIWSSRRARQIFQPLERMAQTMQQVESGALQARAGPVAQADEIGALAGHLDHLLDSIADKTEALQRWNAELDAKVAQRTAELAAAQQQLLRSEKMAAAGQLTASIAHEVNNPIAVIQGNLDLARELLGDDAVKVKAELALVDQQIERMRLIVTQLLQFARPGEYAGYVEAVDCNRVLEDCLLLTGHLLASSRIRIERRFAATHSAGINRQELQQVLVNLMVNAIQTMPDGGTLLLSSADWVDEAGRPGVRLEVADTGPGLDAQLLRELFKPFVTRKKDGTGLGLWISRGIVERYGGDVRAANRAHVEGTGAAGAVFSVLLLEDPASTQT